VLEIIIKRSRTLKIISKYPIEFQLIDIFLWCAGIWKWCLPSMYWFAALKKLMSRALFSLNSFWTVQRDTHTIARSSCAPCLINGCRKMSSNSYCCTVERTASPVWRCFYGLEKYVHTFT
jgi:hypothetical protein